MSDKKVCTKPDCFPYCDCGSADDYVPATPSEDGGEVPEVVGYFVSGSLYVSRQDAEHASAFHSNHTDVFSLMTTAQYSRIVAAKDADISKRDQAFDVMNRTLNAVIEERDELRAQLDAQPAPAAVVVQAELLKRLKDTLEYWINRADTRGMSETDYNTWLALGHRSGAMNELRALLNKEGDS